MAKRSIAARGADAIVIVVTVLLWPRAALAFVPDVAGYVMSDVLLVLWIVLAWAIGRTSPALQYVRHLGRRLLVSGGAGVVFGTILLPCVRTALPAYRQLVEALTPLMFTVASLPVIVPLWRQGYSVRGFTLTIIPIVFVVIYTVGVALR
jgi:hypothetical protein